MAAAAETLDFAIPGKHDYITKGLGPKATSQLCCCGQVYRLDVSGCVVGCIDCVAAAALK